MQDEEVFVQTLAVPPTTVTDLQVLCGADSIGVETLAGVIASPALLLKAE